jgi:quinol monooxygenase YgiN
MTITSVATFTMRAGRESDALALIRAVKRQALEEQPGTLVYLVHRVLDAEGQPTRTLYFYERYRNEAALRAHLASTSWKRVVASWTECFEGSSAQEGIKFFGLKRIAAFERVGAIPIAPR